MIAFFWERLGVERDAAMGVLREAIAEAMRAKTDESPSIKSKMDDVAEAVAAVKRDLIGGLPKMRRAGRADVTDLAVSVNSLSQARRFTGHDASSTEIPYDALRFIRSLPDPAVERSQGEVDKAFSPIQRQYVLGVPRIDSIDVHPAARGLRIDGRLDDWRDAPGFTSALDASDGAEWVDGRMMYDERSLYVAAHVGDPCPLRNVIDPDSDPDAGWMGGGVQVRISTDRRLGWPARGNAAAYYSDRRLVPSEADLAAAANPRLAHLTMWHHAPTGRACLAVAHGMELSRFDVNPDSFEGVFVPDADGLGYVLAAAWQVFWSDASGQMWRAQVVEVRNLAEPPQVYVWEPAANWGRAEYR